MTPTVLRNLELSLFLHLSIVHLIKGFYSKYIIYIQYLLISILEYCQHLDSEFVLITCI